MEAAQVSLAASSKSFNEASGELLTLNTQLANDFNETSSHFQSNVDQLRKEAYGGATVGFLFGPLGPLISFSTAAGVVEGKLVPDLNAKLKAVQELFTNVAALVVKAGADIEGSKKILEHEIREIGEMKTNTESTQLFVEYDDLMLKQLKESASQLIKQCDQYIARHGQKRKPIEYVA